MTEKNCMKLFMPQTYLLENLYELRMAKLINVFQNITTVKPNA